MRKSSYGERDYYFGQLMLTLRTNIGLTQVGLGKLLGVSRRAVAEWEMGSSYPKVEHLKQFILLGLQQLAFAAGREVEEIRTLWKAAHLKVLLDEEWLQGLLSDRLSNWEDHTAPASSLTNAESRHPAEIVAPMVGRTTVFQQLVTSLQQVQMGQAQAVLLVGEAGIGKTRLTQEFATWAQAQNAQVLNGRAIEMGGRLPYQPFVDALRSYLDGRARPERLLEEIWLVELSRLLPDLRLHYPELPVPTKDELTAKSRLFEAIARLLSALARQAPLVLVLEDLHWVDEASLDLLRYLGQYWVKQNDQIMLVATTRPESAPSERTIQLVGLGHDLPLQQIMLQTLSHAETIRLVESLVESGSGTNEDWSEPLRPGSDGIQLLQNSVHWKEIRRRQMQKRVHSRELKLDIVRQVAAGQKCPAQACREYGIAESVLSCWRKEYQERGDSAFQPTQAEGASTQERRIEELEQFCGQLALENQVLKKTLRRLESRSVMQ